MTYAPGATTSSPAWSRPMAALCPTLSGRGERSSTPRWPRCCCASPRPRLAERPLRRASHEPSRLVALDASEQHKDDDDDHDQAQPAAGIIPPTAAIAP